MSVIRAFIAIEMSSEIQNGLDELSALLQDQLQGVPVRWVPVKNIHLTLKFLGNVSPTNIEVMKKILQAEATRHEIFGISVGELGAMIMTQRSDRDNSTCLYALEQREDRVTAHSE